MRTLVWVILPLLVLASIIIVARAVPDDCDGVRVKMTGRC